MKKRALPEEELTKLVQRAQAGDESSYGPMIEMLQDSLFRFFCYLTSDKILAEDLCQDTFIKAIENIKKVQDPSAFQSWLFRMGKNLFLDHLRGRKKSQPLSAQETELHRTEKGKDEINAVVQQALSQISPEDRLVLILVDMEGHSYAEAADIVGISESALRSRLHRIRGEFLKIMK